MLSFVGKEGEQLLGLSTPSGDSYDSTPLYVRVFAPDGKELYQSEGMFNGQPFTVPADGTYKFVILRQYLSAGKDVTVTVWDAADAPAAAKDNHGQQCTYAENSSTCASTSSGVTGNTFSTGDQPGQTCTSTGSVKSCTSETIAAPPDAEHSVDVRGQQQFRDERPDDDSGRPPSDHGWVRARAAGGCSPTSVIWSGARRSSRLRSCTGSRAVPAATCAGMRSSTRWSDSGVEFLRCRPGDSRFSGTWFPPSGR